MIAARRARKGTSQRGALLYRLPGDGGGPEPNGRSPGVVRGRPRVLLLALCVLNDSGVAASCCTCVRRQQERGKLEGSSSEVTGDGLWAGKGEGEGTRLRHCQVQEERNYETSAARASMASFYGECTDVKTLLCPVSALSFLLTPRAVLNLRSPRMHTFLNSLRCPAPVMRSTHCNPTRGACSGA